MVTGWLMVGVLIKSNGDGLDDGEGCGGSSGWVVIVFRPVDQAGEQLGIVLNVLLTKGGRQQDED